MKCTIGKVISDFNVPVLLAADSSY